MAYRIKSKEEIQKIGWYHRASKSYFHTDCMIPFNESLWHICGTMRTTDIIDTDRGSFKVPSWAYTEVANFEDYFSSIEEAFNYFDPINYTITNYGTSIVMAIGEDLYSGENIKECLLQARLGEINE